MTPQEAIDVLERERNKSHWNSLDELKQASDAWKMALEALEKQIPMEPIVEIDTYLCPVCKMPVEYQTMLGDSIMYHGNYDFCPYCGKKILWGEGEE